MSKKFARLNSFALFANLAAAVTSTQTGSDFVDGRLASWKSGLVLLTVTALDVASLDESYQFKLQGRQTSTAAYTDLATILLGGSGVAGAIPGVVGLFIANVDRFYKRMRLLVTIGGTTPSIQYSFKAVCQEFTYLPDVGTVITA